MTPAQVNQAYGFNAISSNGIVGNGAGQTIAIIDAYDDPKFVDSTSPNFASSDLHQFDLAFGLPDPPSFIKVAQDGSNNYPAQNTGWDGEIALDVEWAHALAPMANILLVEANDNSYTNLINGAENYARQQPGVSVVTMSFGGGEFTGENSLDSYFTTPAGHTGVTFVASTGDSGSPGGYPGLSPNVLAVGGTTLTLGAGNSYGGETAWSGGGGGLSTLESEPVYQRGVVTQTTTQRAIPDVSFDADPNSGVAVYDTVNNSPASPWWQVGGTSLAAPSWAALIGITDQLRMANGFSTLDGPSQTLPNLYKLPSTDFHDITTGSNGTYSAGVGYDLVTGRGTPIANLLVPDLAGVPKTAYPAVEIPTQGVWRYSDATGWQQLTSANASLVAADASDDVTAEFPGFGVWRYQDATGWQQLTPSDASLLVMDANGDLAAEFPGQGVWRYESATGWQQLNTANASLLAINDHGDLAVELPGQGVWRYESATGWQQLNTANASLLAIDAAGDVAVEFSGQGVWRYQNATGWKQLNTANISLLAMDAGGDVAVEIPGQGVWRVSERHGLEAVEHGQRLAAGDGRQCRRGGRASRPGRLALREHHRLAAIERDQRFPAGDGRQRQHGRGRRSGGRGPRPGRVAVQRRRRLAAVDAVQRLLAGDQRRWRSGG